MEVHSEAEVHQVMYEDESAWSSRVHVINSLLAVHDSNLLRQKHLDMLLQEHWSAAAEFKQGREDVSGSDELHVVTGKRVSISPPLCIV